MQEHTDLEGKIHLVKEREDSEEYTRAMSRSKLGKHNDRVRAQKAKTQSTMSLSSVGEHIIQGAKKIIRNLTGSTNNSNPDVQEVSGLDDDDPYEGEQPFEESESAPGRKGSKRRDDGNDSDEYVPSDDENREDRRGPHRDTR
jgi:hypothetical protein